MLSLNSMEKFRKQFICGNYFPSPPIQKHDTILVLLTNLFGSGGALKLIGRPITLKREPKWSLGQVPVPIDNVDNIKILSMIFPAMENASIRSRAEF